MVSLVLGGAWASLSASAPRGLAAVSQLPAFDQVENFLLSGLGLIGQVFRREACFFSPYAFGLEIFLIHGAGGGYAEDGVLEGPVALGHQAYLDARVDAGDIFE